MEKRKLEEVELLLKFYELFVRALNRVIVLMLVTDLLFIAENANEF